MLISRLLQIALCSIMLNANEIQFCYWLLRCSNRNTVWWCIAQYSPLICTCCMVGTYSQATRRDQNQCSLGSFGLVIKLRDCDIGLERDSSSFERKKMKRERENPTLHLKPSMQRTDMHTNAHILLNWVWEMSWGIRIRNRKNHQS